MEDTTLPQVLPKTLKKKIKKRIVTTNDESDDSNSVNSNIGSKTLNLISQTTLLNPPIAPFSSNPIISKLQKMIDSCESDSSDEFSKELPKTSPIIMKKIITTPTLTLTRQQYFDNYNKILKKLHYVFITTRLDVKKKLMKTTHIKPLDEGGSTKPVIKKKNDKIIGGSTVRKNTEHKGMWDIKDTRAGQLTGKASFTGTMKEVREAIKLGNQIAKAQGVK